MATFNILLQDSDFQSVLEQNCPDMGYNAFINIYAEADNSAFPLKSSIPKKFMKRLPWKQME